MRISRAMTGFGLLALALAVPYPAASADALVPGSPAPELAVSKWLQGEPVAGFEKGKTYVVEFWATWCGPCRVTIPHLNELSKKYKDKATFVGVSIWEDDPSQVEPFIKEMGDKMTYRVALDEIPEGGVASDGKMAKGWMEAAKQEGIPTAFIVNGEGKVAWIGHPAEMDKPLEEVVAGKFDIAAAAAKAKEDQEKREKVSSFLGKLQKAMEGGNADEAIKVIDEMAAAVPETAGQLSIQKYSLLLTVKKDVKAAVAYATGIMKDLKDEPMSAQILNNFAWTMIDPDGPEIENPDYDFALAAAEKASKMLKDEDPAVLDTLGLAFFKKGDIKKAIATQEKAVELGKKHEIEGLGELEDRLKEYKDADK